MGDRETAFRNIQDCEVVVIIADDSYFEDLKKTAEYIYASELKKPLFLALKKGTKPPEELQEIIDQAEKRVRVQYLLGVYCRGGNPSLLNNDAS